MTVWVEVSSDGGRSYVVPAKTFSGHIGQGVSPGSNRAIVWNAESDFDGILADQMRVRINARGGVVPIPPTGMVLIPGGHFQMGEWVDGSSAGTRTVYTSAYFMDRYEVSGALWTQVRDWAIQNGYAIGQGSSRAVDHPIGGISWYDAVRWCNARSEKDELTPVYYTDTAWTTVYRSGDVGLANAMVKWNANGYRLPTEAEWEKAARGGFSGKAYPWGDTIDGSKANYRGSGGPWAGGSSPVGYYNGNQTPSGTDMANGYGLYDISGNFFAWCWDWYGSVGGESNPRGPNSGAVKVLRGGSWADTTNATRCADRHYYDAPGSSGFGYWGFRCVRSL